MQQRGGDGWMGRLSFSSQLEQGSLFEVKRNFVTSLRVLLVGQLGGWFSHIRAPIGW